MVTYLVVLLQFQISIPTDSRDLSMNITLGDMLNNMAMDSLENDMTLLMTDATVALTTTTTTARPSKARQG